MSIKDIKNIVLMKQSISVALMGVAMVAVVSSMGLTGIFATGFSPVQETTGKAMQANTGMLGHITLVTKNAEGKIIGYQQTDNLVTNMGVDCTTIKLFATATNTCASGSPGTFDVIGIGTGTTAAAATQTALVTEQTTNGLGRVVASTHSSAGAASGSASVSISNVFTDTTATTSALDEAGIFDSTTVSGSNMLARQVFSSPVTLNVGDSLTVTWTITTT